METTVFAGSCEFPELFALQKLFGHNTYRPGQLESIKSIISGKDTLTLIPTGGGKSVIYTIAGVLKQGLTVVIEPLKFIMEEQAEKLREKICTSIFLQLLINRNGNGIYYYFS